MYSFEIVRCYHHNPFDNMYSYNGEQGPKRKGSVNMNIAGRLHGSPLSDVFPDMYSLFLNVDRTNLNIF